MELVRVLLGSIPYLAAANLERHAYLVASFASTRRNRAPDRCSSSLHMGRGSRGMAMRIRNLCHPCTILPSRTSTGPPLQKFLAALRRPRGMFPAPCRRLALRPSNGARLPALARPSAPPPACCTSLRRPRQCGLARRHPPLTGVPAPPHHPTRPLPSPSQCRWGGVGASRIGRRMEAVDCFQIELTNWLISQRVGRLCRAGTQAGMREEVRKNSDVWWNLSRSAGFSVCQRFCQTNCLTCGPPGGGM